MKKFICIVLVLALCASLTACCAIGGSGLKSPIASVGGSNALARPNGLESFLGNFLDNILEKFQKENDWTNGFDNSWSVGEQTGQNVQVEQVEQDTQDDDELEMPDLVDEDIFTARETLDRMGIFYETSYEYSGSYDEDRVISQSISPGFVLSGDETVLLTVSKGAEECPYEYSQKLVVSAASGSSYATASLYEWYDGDWNLVATYSATVGSNGIGRAYEGSRRTPQGLFKLGVVLSSYSLDTNMDVHYTTSTTCVVDDPDSVYYNCIMERSHVPSGTSYDQIGRGLNDGSHYAFIYIEHNGTGLSSDGVVPGAGSVMGVRGTYKSLGPTFGDVDISAQDMRDLLSRLDIDQNPMIELIIE